MRKIIYVILSFLLLTTIKTVMVTAEKSEEILFENDMIEIQVGGGVIKPIDLSQRTESGL